MDWTPDTTKLWEGLRRKRGTTFCGDGTHTTHGSQSRIKFKVNESENRSLVKNYTVAFYFIHVTKFRFVATAGDTVSNLLLNAGVIRHFRDESRIQSRSP